MKIPWWPHRIDDQGRQLFSWPSQLRRSASFEILLMTSYFEIMTSYFEIMTSYFEIVTSLFEILLMTLYFVIVMCWLRHSRHRLKKTSGLLQLSNQTLEVLRNITLLHCGSTSNIVSSTYVNMTKVPYENNNLSSQIILLSKCLPGLQREALSDIHFLVSSFKILLIASTWKSL